MIKKIQNLIDKLIVKFHKCDNYWEGSSVTCEDGKLVEVEYKCSVCGKIDKITCSLDLKEIV